MDNSMYPDHQQLGLYRQWLLCPCHQRPLLQYSGYLKIMFEVIFGPKHNINTGRFRPKIVLEACSSVIWSSVCKLVWLTKNVFEIIASAPALMNFSTSCYVPHINYNKLFMMDYTIKLYLMGVNNDVAWIDVCYSGPNRTWIYLNRRKKGTHTAI